jgi:hypothetical protein
MPNTLTDDVLRCPACGSTDVAVTFPYQVGQWAAGRAVCCNQRCRASFQFKFDVEPEEQGQGQGR